MHLAGHASGRVALTEIHDIYVENALEGLEVGQFVACRVLPGNLCPPMSCLGRHVKQQPDMLSSLQAFAVPHRLLTQQGSLSVEAGGRLALLYVSCQLSGQGDGTVVNV